MRTTRFYHPTVLTVDTQVQLSPEATHHCVNVLRLKVNEPIVLFDGSGKEYASEIALCDRRNVTVDVQTEIALDPQSPLSLHLAQCVSKGDKMEWALQKATELGVTEITPVISERCSVKLDPQRWQKKHEQWLKILIGACEQCGRNTLPMLHPIISLREFVSQSTTQHRVLLSPTAELSFNHCQAEAGKGYRMLIGPEGGLSDAEIHLATEYGFKAYRFGRRILRTETATTAAIAVLQSRYGDLI